MGVRPHTVGMVVKDMGRALAFYRALGLAIPEDAGDAPHVEVTGADGYTPGFDTEALVRQTDPEWREPDGQRVNLQFEIGSPAEVDAAYDKLTGEGADDYKAPWDAFWGQRFARVTDPDGNVVSLFADL